MSPDLVMDGLRGLAAVLSIGSSVKNLSQKNQLQPAQALEKFKETATPEQLKQLQDPQVVQSTIGMMVITQRLLSQLADEADKCERTYIEARGRAKTDRALDEAKEKAQKCMCRVLRDIRGHNNGNLPGQIFEDWWDAYQCP
ncbi:hypothetical protein [Methylobacterium sp. yr668]|uniref:hypothetical protein n=1 Tax=Methylobacterium sp. yr668 TaxID=1761801 RepID=UPI001114E777|nr:hypothetical protein [Methylobacterium sp. yr668]